MFLLPVHLRLPVNLETSRARQREPVHVCVSAAPWYRIFGEPTCGGDGDAVNICGCRPGRGRQQQTMGLPHVPR